MGPRVILWLPAIILLALSLMLPFVVPLPTTHATATAPITLGELQHLSSLTSLSVPWEQMIETNISGYLGGVNCLVRARGKITIGTDLSQADLVIDKALQIVTITLPQPTIVSTNVDMAKTRILSVGRDGLWRLLMSEAGEAAVIAAALKQADIVITEHPLTETIRSEARRQTETVLGQLTIATDWQIVTRWKPASW